MARQTWSACACGSIEANHMRKDSFKEVFQWGCVVDRPAGAVTTVTGFRAMDRNSGTEIAAPIHGKARTTCKTGGTEQTRGGVSDPIRRGASGQRPAKVRRRRTPFRKNKPPYPWKRAHLISDALEPPFKNEQPIHSRAASSVPCLIARSASSSCATSAPPMRCRCDSSHRPVVRRSSCSSRRDSWPAQMTT